MLDGCRLFCGGTKAMQSKVESFSAQASERMAAIETKLQAQPKKPQQPQQRSRQLPAATAQGRLATAAPSAVHAVQRRAAAAKPQQQRVGSAPSTEDEQTKAIIRSQVVRKKIFHATNSSCTCSIHANVCSVCAAQ